MESVNIRKYIISFSACYTIGVVTVFIVLTVLDLEGNSGISVGILIASALYAVIKFIDDNKRAPNKTEKNKLVWQSLLMSWLVSLVLFLIAAVVILETEDISFLGELVTQTNIAIFLGAAVFITLIQWGILVYSYGPLAKRRYAALLKKGKI